MEKEYAKYLLAKTKEDYNLIAEDFSSYRKKPWLEAKFLIDDYIISAEKVLDLGCGVGQWFEFFKDKNVDYVGINNSEKLIEIAKKKYPQTRFLLADALSLPFPNDYFNKVYVIALLHHIPSEELRLRVLQEAKRTLKRGGFLILTGWNLWQKWRTRKLIYKFILSKIFRKSRLNSKDILMDWGGMKNCYFHCFTKDELRKLVKEAGFNIIKDGEFLVGLERKQRPKLPNSNFYIIGRRR